MIIDKFEHLEKILLSYAKIIVAFSGGVDSSFLLYFSVKLLGCKNVTAVVGVSETYTSSELDNARYFANSLNVKLIEINTNEFYNPTYLNNPIDRCYHCKSELYSTLTELSQKIGTEVIVDGTNYSDMYDYRPGKKAASEHQVKSPIALAKITKDEIRDYLKKENLDFYDKPSSPCLASRIPYNEIITKEKLMAIEKGEVFLKNLGFKIVRVRHHDKIARIEIEKKYFDTIIKDDMLTKISEYFKSIGFTWITLDIDGFKSGNLNKVIKQK